MMYKSKSIIVKIEPDFKERVESIFQSLGMTTSQAISIFLKQVELNHGLPFEIKLPNEPNTLTKKVLQESIEGLPKFKNTDDLLEELNS